MTEESKEGATDGITEEPKLTHDSAAEGNAAEGSAAEDTDAEDTARTTGRGFLVITGAKAWFFVSAAILNFGLPILFTSEAEYGTYGIVINAVSILNMVMITGTLQAVSKLVAEEPARTGSIARRASIIQLGVGLPLAAAYALLADPIATWLRDPGYAPLLRISALIVAAYSFYAIYVGCFNGRKEFTRQAALDMFFATMRTGCILGAVALGFGVGGAVAGFALAAGIVMVFSGLWLRKTLDQSQSESNEETPTLRLASFLVSVMAYTFVLNIVMRVDLFALKRLSVDALVELTDPTTASNALAGAYNLMLNVARLPYQAVIAVAFVIFPMVSRTTFAADKEATASYIDETLRYSLIIVGLFTAVFAGVGDDVIRPLYPNYAFAGDTLVLLCLAYGAFALLYIATTILIAAGRPWVATALTLLCVGVMAAVCWIAIPGSEPGAHMLQMTAWSACAGMGVALLAAAAVLHTSYGAFMPTLSLVRLTLIIGALIVAGRLTAFDHFVEFADALPWSADALRATATKPMIGSRTMWLAAAAGKAALVGLAYLVLLFATGELGKQDRERVARVIRRKKKVHENSG